MPPPRNTSVSSSLLGRVFGTATQPGMVSEDDLAESLTNVVLGRSSTYEEMVNVDPVDGTVSYVRVKSKKYTTTPEAQARGLIIADRLLGGRLGLTKSTHLEPVTDQDRRLYLEFNGEPDEEIIATTPPRAFAALPDDEK